MGFHVSFQECICYGVPCGANQGAPKRAAFPQQAGCTVVSELQDNAQAGSFGV